MIQTTQSRADSVIIGLPAELPAMDRHSFVARDTSTHTVPVDCGKRHPWTAAPCQTTSQVESTGE